MRNEPAAGMATLEIVLAFAVLAIVVSSVAPVALGNATVVADAHARQEAVVAARQTLDDARAAARHDFRSVVHSSRFRDGTRIDLSVTETDTWTKRLAATATWSSATGRTSTLRTTTLVTDRDLEETCAGAPTGDWRRPRLATFDLATLVGDPSGRYSVTGLDAFDGRLYVTTTGGVGQSTFFVFDVANLALPRLLGGLDNDPAVAPGPAAVAVASVRGRPYALLASASSFSRGQFQVVDAGDPASFSPRTPIVTYKIPSSAVPTAGVGNSVFYRRGYAYLGLTATSGDEFDVIDVRDPLKPRWLGGAPLGGHAANAIRARDGYAYVAHPAGRTDATPEQLTVLRVADPTAPARVGGFFSEGGLGGNGKSLDLADDTLFFGRTATNISGNADALPELLTLDFPDPEAVPREPPGIATLATGDSTNGVIVRGGSAFLLTNRQFQTWDVSDPRTPRPWSSDGTTSGFSAIPGKGAAFDCEGNVFFVGANDDAGIGSLTMITST